MDTNQKQFVDEQITEPSEVIYPLAQIALAEEECYEDLTDVRKSGAEGLSTLDSAISALKTIQKTLEGLT